MRTLCPRADPSQAEFPEIEEVGRLVSGSVVRRAETAEQTPEREGSSLPMQRKLLQRPEGLRLKRVEMGGEGAETLGRGQCVAVCVVGSVHGQPEGADHLSEPDRIPGGGPLPAEPAELAVERRRIDNRVAQLRAARREGSLEEAALDLGDVRDDGPPGERL